MATITGHSFPAGTPADAPEVLAAVRKLHRDMPSNMGYQWLITIAVYPNRTEVHRHAQIHHGFEARQSAEHEQRSGATSPVKLAHWRLADWSDIFSDADVAALRKLEF